MQLMRLAAIEILHFVVPRFYSISSSFNLSFDIESLFKEIDFL